MGQNRPISCRCPCFQYLIQTFVVNVVAVSKDVHRLGKHAFISDSSDDFRFCPRSVGQINPSFEFPGHLPIHFVDDAVPEKNQITHKYQENSRKYVSLQCFNFTRSFFLKQGNHIHWTEISFSLWKSQKIIFAVYKNQSKFKILLLFKFYLSTHWHDKKRWLYSSRKTSREETIRKNGIKF